MKTRHSLNVEHPRRRIQNRPEQNLQFAVVELLNAVLPKSAFFAHYPAGGYRSKAEAGIFKRMGVKAGIPDLIILWNGLTFGIELKAEGEDLSDDQRVTQPLMRAAGARIEVARSVDEVIQHLIEFGLPLRLSTDEFAHYERRAAA